MFLHIGGDVIVRLRELVALVDARAADKSPDTKDFLHSWRSLGRTEAVAGGPVKTYIVCVNRVYLSPISVATLRRRIGLLPDQEQDAGSAAAVVGPEQL